MVMVTMRGVGGLDVRVGCIFEELCDEVGGALEGDCLAGRGLRCGHGVSAKQGGERVLDARKITWRCFAVCLTASHQLSSTPLTPS